jgi:lipoate-protein ligase A
MKKWRLIRSGACTPDYNMAVDEAIMLSVGAGTSPPTLRLYGWNPATLSIGYFQKAEIEVDLARVRESNYGFVRRPTGGRSVLHDRELTYAIIVPENYAELPKSVTQSYRVLSEGMLLGFQALGLHASMVSQDGEKDSKQSASLSSAACFDSPSWYELVVNGLKVAGSAQWRHRGAVLQHGSILLDLNIEQLFSLLRFRTDEQRMRMQKLFAKRATAINPLRNSLGLHSVHAEDVEQAFTRGWSTALGVTFEHSELTRSEHNEAVRLAQEKYNSALWNLRR